MRNKDIIKQYVNTGNRIRSTQIEKLNNNLKNSYFRKRTIISKNLNLSIEQNKLIDLAEYSLMNEYQKNEIFPYLFITSSSLKNYFNEEEMQEFIHNFLSFKTNSRILYNFINETRHHRLFIRFNTRLDSFKLIIDYWLDNSMYILIGLIEDMPNKDLFYEGLLYIISKFRIEYNNINDENKLINLVRYRRNRMKMGDETANELIALIKQK